MHATHREERVVIAIGKSLGLLSQPIIQATDGSDAQLPLSVEPMGVAFQSLQPPSPRATSSGGSTDLLAHVSRGRLAERRILQILGLAENKHALPLCMISAEKEDPWCGYRAVPDAFIQQGLIEIKSKGMIELEGDRQLEQYCYYAEKEKKNVFLICGYDNKLCSLVEHHPYVIIFRTHFCDVSSDPFDVQKEKKNLRSFAGALGSVVTRFLPIKQCSGYERQQGKR